MSEVETCLSKREEFKSNDPRDVLRRTEYQDKIDRGLKEIEDGLMKMETVLRAQKNKPKKYGDVSYKEDAKRLMEERYKLLMSRNDGIPINEKEMNDNRTHLEKLDALLIERADQQARGQGAPDRELYQEEKDVMDKWKSEINKQDRVLEGVGNNLKVLKNEVREIGVGIGDIGKNIDKTKKMADKTEVTLKTTNAKLKDLLTKLRSGDKICVDIILLCVCLGLIAVLYNIVKSKFFNKTSTTTTAKDTTTTRFLFELD